jgi:hypothetical protein
MNNILLPAVDGLDVDLEHTPDFFSAVDGLDVDLEHTPDIFCSCGRLGRGFRTYTRFFLHLWTAWTWILNIHQIFFSPLDGLDLDL